MLSIVHLQTFLAVAEAGTYTAAGRALNLTQPAVSQHIHALEEQLDHVKLFRRVGQRMVPTSAGEELLTAAREMMQLAVRAEDMIKAMKGQVAGRVAVGCSANSGDLLLPPLLKAFTEKFPGVSLSVSLAQPEQLVEGLAEHQLHLVLLEEVPRRRGWDVQSLGAERVHLLAPRGHVLAGQPPVQPAELKQHRLILPRQGTVLRRLIDDGLRRRGVATRDLQVVLESDSPAFTVRMVQEGLGLAFVPQSRVPRLRDMVVITLGGVSVQQEWHVVRAREGAPPRAVQELFDFLVGPEARRTLVRSGLRPPSDRSPAPRG